METNTYMQSDRVAVLGNGVLLLVIVLHENIEIVKRSRF